MDDPPRSSSTTPVPASDEMIRLNWNRNSIHNTVISSEDNEIMYEVTTPHGVTSTNRVTTLTKLEWSTGKKTVTGEIAWKTLRSQTEVRFGSDDGECVLADEWLKSSTIFSTAKSFTTGSGVQYRWKLRDFKHVLTAAQDPPEGRPPALAIFHINIMKGPTGPAYLEVAPSVVSDLDYILSKIYLAPPSSE